MLLIQNAHIKTMAGADIPNGCLLIEDGKIAAVAPEIDAPVGAKVIDAQGRLLTPGCVEAHCHIGLDNQSMRWEGMDYNAPAVQTSSAARSPSSSWLASALTRWYCGRPQQ